MLMCGRMKSSFGGRGVMGEVVREYLHTLFEWETEYGRLVRAVQYRIV